MTACERTAELLPWYLNGTLTEEEANEVRRHLSECDRCRAEQRATAEVGAFFDSHPSPEDLISHLLGEAGKGLSRERIERHVSECAECREELRLLGEGIPTAGPEAEQRRGPVEESTVAILARSMRPRGAAPPRWFALAASLLAVAGVAGWWATWHDLSEQRQRAAELATQLDANRQTTIPGLQREAAVAREHAFDLERRLAEVGSPLVSPPILDLLPRGALRGPASGVPVIPRGTRVAILILDTGGLRPSEEVSLILVDATGRIAATVPALRVEPHGGVTVGLPTSTLAPGRYELRLHRGSRVVARYDLQVD